MKQLEDWGGCDGYINRVVFIENGDDVFRITQGLYKKTSHGR